MKEDLCSHIVGERILRPWGKSYTIEDKAEDRVKTSGGKKWPGLVIPFGPGSSLRTYGWIGLAVTETKSIQIEISVLHFLFMDEMHLGIYFN